MSWDDSKRRLLRALQDTVAERLEGDEAEPVRQLAEQLLEAFPTAELRARGQPDLFGWLVGTWRFLQNFNAWQPKVRVFNPDYQRHGWHSGHTVVAILCREQPFTADSVRNELNSRGIDILTIQYIPLRVVRDADHQLQKLLGAGDSGEPDGQREALLYLEIRRNTDADELAALQRSLDLLLSEVGLVVDDFMPMLGRVKQARDDVAAMTVNDAAYRQEVLDLLEWLVNGHFTFLGYEYLEVDYQGDAPRVRAPVAQKLGLLRLRDTLGIAELERELDTDNTAGSEGEHRHCVAFVQSSVRNRVHRHVYPDYVNIRIFDQQGRLVCKHRFLGLYTSRAYNLNPTQIPLVRRKISAVMQRAAFDPQGQKSSELLRVLETYPRDDLFQATTDQLYVAAMGILDIQERRQVRLFVREDPRGRFVSCQVFIPRDKYNTELRQRVQTLLSDAFHAAESEFTTFFSESILIRTHFIFRVQPSRPAVDTAALEQELVQVTMNWHDHLRVHLLDEFGEERGSELTSLYQQAFPAGYIEDFDPRTAILDIQRTAELSDDNPLSMSLYRMNNDSEEQMRFRLLHLHEPLALSDVMPILENLGLRVEGERPHGIRRRDGLVVWMHEFSVVYKLSGTLDIHQVGDVFEDAFARIWSGHAESDSFNRLILGTQLGWRPIAMLRAYAKYMKQTQFTFSTEFIADTLARQMDITRTIVELFEVRLKPGLDADRAQRQQAAEEALQQALEEVGSLSEDRVIRQYLALIQATLRSNYYQSDAEGQLKSYFSFKLNPEAVPDMPLPRPLYEIFVYSPRVEGVHLRGGKVARGGLRWSDRYEDFRTEVLGLVKAQQVKNSVIVPTGAKGGFVCKSLDADASRDVRQAEAIACYRIFIQGLLDITDNLVGHEVVPPRDVTRHDGDDPYLVVAADKGTATFSDFANEIAQSYNFWLGDAFASGGSQGYDHKKMGITARGAWVSVQRHFRELGINIQTTPFTAVGIGDMAGDVFGNGMLRSPQIKLLAAFNHQHIFIDPTPDPETSFAERQRLFALPRSSWEDYDKALISSGGGVFSRSAKSISLSPEIRQHLAIDAERLTPAELIHALLKAPVDLLWNGGIGTYIKASTQSHADCGDKANDALRVNGNELRCKVLGEGGNLGATQLGRIEYALKGGLCNTDFVDNAGGVDCSDHEVNIKILLNAVMAAGDMTEKQRRALLEAMTDDVAELVLANIYRQTQAISLAEREALMRQGEYRRLIQALEARGRLDRALEFIPDEEQLTERKAGGKALTRPELAILISYAKAQLKDELVTPQLSDDPLIAQALFGAFPARLQESFSEPLQSHHLRREIIATEVANDIVNRMGSTFVLRMTQSTGADAAAVASAYVTAREVFAVEEDWRAIEQLDYSVDADLQMEMMVGLMRVVRRVTRWFIRNRRGSLRPQEELAQFGDALRELERELPDIVNGRMRERLQKRRQELCDRGVPDALAARMAASTLRYPCLGVIEIARQLDAPLRKVAEVYFELAQQLELDWFAGQITNLKIENHWQALARESYRDDLEWQLRSLTAGAMRHICAEGDVEACVARWSEQQKHLVKRWRAMLTELHSTEVHEFAMYSVAIRELLDLAQSSRFETAA